MDLSLYYELRVNQIVHELYKCCGEYAVAEEKRSFLYEQLLPIIKSTKDICITYGDCVNIMDYVDTVNVLLSITAQQLYKRGAYDCLELLRKINI